MLEAQGRENRSTEEPECRRGEEITERRGVWGGRGWGWGVGAHEALASRPSQSFTPTKHVLHAHCHLLNCGQPHPAFPAISPGQDSLGTLATHALLSAGGSCHLSATLTTHLLPGPSHRAPKSILCSCVPSEDHPAPRTDPHDAMHLPHDPAALFLPWISES